MLNIENIVEVRKAIGRKGYEIVFNDGSLIWVVKRRALAGLLLLLKYQVCSEADLAGANTRLAEIKQSLKGKIPPDWIQDRYGDANKPFSELWTEEGFSCVRAEGLQGNRQYVLKTEDHEMLFSPNAKANRMQLTALQKKIVLDRQSNRCNFCNAVLKEKVSAHTFAKDRVRLEYDHRVPIDRGGNDSIENIQALCHYCNKCKRQMCFVCKLENCSSSCALVTPEENSIVLATGEDVRDRIISHTEKNVSAILEKI